MAPFDPALAASRPAPAAAPNGALSPARALIEGQLAMLSRLAEIGMEIAEACGREARAAAAEAGPGSRKGDAAPSPEPRRDPGLTFARVARAVRMTIALQSRLAGDLAALDRADALAEKRQQDMRRIRLSRLAGQAARESVAARRAAASPAEAWGRSDDEAAIEDEVEQLSAEAYERLVDAEDSDLWDRTFDEVVAGICADLGLSPAWQARLTAAAAPPDPARGAPDDARKHAAGDAASHIPVDTPAAAPAVRLAPPPPDADPAPPDPPRPPPPRPPPIVAPP